MDFVHYSYKMQLSEEQIMLDNRIKFDAFTLVKTPHNNPQKEIVIEIHNNSTENWSEVQAGV